MQYATICSNSGTMGTPVADGLFGPEGVFLSAIFLIPLRIAMWTLGIAFFTGKREKGLLRRILIHPCIAAVLAGTVLMLTQLPLPVLVTDCLSTVGSCNAALSMILIGSIMSRMDLRLLWHRDTLFYSAVRLVLLPAGVLLACLALKLPPMVRNVSVILTAMPAGSTTSILALQYGGDAPFASACTALTTVLSLAAVPLWCQLLWG